MTADLTRWNRAGLRRFRYVQGNAAEYLETIRNALAARFHDGTPFGKVLSPDSDPVEHQRRILEQYHAERRDWAWEIARVFARASHVLAEHVDAFANEGFIETATQWDLLRRLVEMLGYHPAPPASASTLLALHAKPDASAPVKAGFQVKFSPKDGKPPVVFETLEDLTIDPALNEVRLARWDRSEQPFLPFTAIDATPWKKPAKAAISVGQLALLVQEGNDALGIAVQASVASIAAVTGDAVALGESAAGRAFASGWRRGFTRLLAVPAKVMRPHLNGPGVVRLDRAAGLAAGDVVAWVESGTWHFDAVTRAEGDALQLEHSHNAPRGALFRAIRLTPVTDASGNPAVTEFRFPLNVAAAAYRTGSGFSALSSADLTPQTPKQAGVPPAYYTLGKVLSPMPLAIYALPIGAPELGQVVMGDLPAGWLFDGVPAGLVSGTWVIAEFGAADGTLLQRAATVDQVVEHESSFRVTLRPAPTPTTASDPVLARLLLHLRRLEAVVDEPSFRALRLSDLYGDLRGWPVSVVQGIGPAYTLALKTQKVTTVGELAALPASAVVAGMSEVVLRELRSRAESILRFAGEVEPITSLRDARMDAILRLERDAAPEPYDQLSLVRLYGPCKHDLPPVGHDRNPIPLGAGPYAPAGSLPPAFKSGHIVLIEREDDPAAYVRQAIATRLEDGHISFEPPLDTSEDFTLGNTIIRANVVRAGHGEAKPERLLGSGNAALLSQEFVVEVAGISFVADSTMPSGVRADIAVLVDGRIWQAVSSLRDSGPADPHYTVRMTEEGYLRIGFGDGKNGRRLPTGTNNVRVRYRAGNGVIGNLPAHSLEKPMKPHISVGAILQPMPAIGGNDLETIASIRANAPASLLALERAVSLSDFADLAASQSSVWQAKAFPRSAGVSRLKKIDVVVVPANGAPLDFRYEAVVAPDFLNQQRRFLLRHALPEVDVRTLVFQPVLVSMQVTIRVKSAAYEPSAVIERVRAALWQAFSLRRRALGQPLHRSEVYRVVEEVVGVENSVCTISLLAGDAMVARTRRVLWQTVDREDLVRSILAFDSQVIYLDPALSTVDVAAREYEL